MELWNNEYPCNIGHANSESFELYLNSLNELENYFIINSDTIIAWTFTFHRDNKRQFGIIIDEKQQGKGIGKILMQEIMDVHSEFYAWVINDNNYLKSNGQIYQSPLPFYRQLGFKVNSEIKIETESISAVQIHWKKS